VYFQLFVGRVSRYCAYSQWLKSSRELRDFIKRSGMYVSQLLLKTRVQQRQKRRCSALAHLPLLQLVPFVFFLGYILSRLLAAAHES
jgi:hypothetical protein